VDVYIDETELMDSLIERAMQGIAFNFAEGFDLTSFEDLTPEGYIPVVVSYDTYVRRRLTLGDTAVYGYANEGDNWQLAIVQMKPLPYWIWFSMTPNCVP
jgi:hypothetical protein